MAVLEGEQTTVADFDPGAHEAVRGEPVPPDDIQVTGTGQLDLFAANGKRPSRATLSVSVPKVALQAGTAFAKGETVVLQLVAVINGEGTVDKLDKATGIAVEAVAEFKARVTDVRLVTDG